MRKRKNDIERYLRGELSPAEMHALEKEALTDPFLAEALEGIEHAGADNFLHDLHRLNRSVHNRTRARSRKNKTIKMWGWSAGVAASVLLVAVSGFLVVSLLKDQKRAELAMKEKVSPAPDSNPESDTIARALEEEAVTGIPAETPVPPRTAKTEKTPDPITDTEPASEKKETVSDKDPLLAREEQSPGHDESKTEEIAAAEIKEAIPELEEKDAVVVEQELSGKLSERVAGVQSKKTAPAVSRALSGDTRLLTGNVVSAQDGSALPGVNVLIKGTNSGTVTDSQGNFQLSVPAEETQLVFAFIGFETREVDVAGETEINVQLGEDVAQLSEVVVTGYGSSSDKSGTEAGLFRFAEPAGGRNDFKKYLSTELKYPAEAIKNKVEGKVTIRFTVEPDGKLTDFEVIKGIGNGCDEELIRLIRQGPAWKPSTRDNQPVRDQVKVRFRFELPKK